MDQFEGRTAFITGGASGIGFAMAQAFAAAGMKVAIADIEAGPLEAAVAKLKEGNADVIGLRLDVRDRDAMTAAAQEVKETFGNVHVLCNNAGIGAGGPMQTLTHDDWDWCIGVNLNGVVNGIQAFLPDMVAHGEGGHVVNTASMAGLFGAPNMGPYCATKFAVVGLSESLAADVAAQGIGVSVLCPGVVATNIFTSERNRPAELAETVEREPDPEQVARWTAAIEKAQSPEDVAEKVLEAVRANRFWIFTHPEYASLMKGRMEQIVGAFPELPDGVEPLVPGAQ